VIEVHLDLGGLPVTLADTAGLREALDSVESEGVRRARARAEAADLRLAVFDATAWPALDPATAALLGPGTLALLNKADLAPGLPPEPTVSAPSGEAVPALPVSALTGAGMDALLEALEARLRDRLEGAGPPPLTRARHRAALEEAVAALSRVGATPGQAPELVAEELRLAARALGRITGRVDVEDVLDAIFAEFCIGK
jgi:tRNA modification GTPase